MRVSRPLVLLLGGLAVLLGSALPLGKALHEAYRERPVVRLPFDADSRLAATAVTLSPGQRARLVLELTVDTASVTPDPRGDTTAYRARYRLPVTYRVRTAAGEICAEAHTYVDWRDDARDLSGRARQSSVLEEVVDVDAAGGTVALRAVFRVFDVPADGQVTVTATLGTDSTYGARATPRALHIEHAIDNPTTRIVLGVFMAIAGFVAGVVGFVQVATRPLPPTPASVPLAGAEADAVRRLAVWGHLAALLGYVLPFANVLAPLVLWMKHRARHPYLDQQGREAINFQLSVLVYLLLAFGLLLALIGLVLIPIIVVLQLVLVVRAARHARAGAAWRYPLSLRFLR